MLSCPERLLRAARRRYLNSCAAKALFRAGEVEAAERMALRFTKDGDQPSNLTEMQAMWYEIEAGNAHLARREYGMVRPAWTSYRVLMRLSDMLRRQLDRRVGE